MLPRNPKDPLGADRSIPALRREFDARMSWLFKQLSSLLDSMPRQTDQGAILGNAREYLYLVDMDRLMETVRALFEEAMKPFSESLVRKALAAYSQGSATGHKSVSSILESSRELTQLLVDFPYLQRAAYVKARVFEEMRGFTAKSSAQLGSVLLDGIVKGEGLSSIKSAIKKEFGVSARRAETIARTEVIGAKRRGRWEQAEATAEQNGVEIGLLWLSALSPTTRDSHAELHGQVLTPDEVRDFYSQDANGINCKCSQVEVLMVDGKPLQEKLVSRETERKATYFKGDDK